MPLPLRSGLENFDAVFSPVADSTQAPRPSPAPNAEDVDLGSVQPKVEEVVEPKETPPSMSLEEFKKKHPTVTATVALNLGIAP